MASLPSNLAFQHGRERRDEGYLKKGARVGPLADAVRSIAWQDGDANRALTQKTRRAVRDAVISTQEKRTLQRRNLGFAILGFVFMLILLGPAIWNGMEDLLEEEHLFDMPTQLGLLIAMLLACHAGGSHSRVERTTSRVP